MSWGWAGARSRGCEARVGEGPGEAGARPGRLRRASAKGARKGGDRRGSGSRAGHSAGQPGRGFAQHPGAGRGRGLEVAKRGAEGPGEAGARPGRLRRASAKGARKGGDRRGSGSRAGHSAGQPGRGFAQRPGAGRGRGLKVAKRGAERVRARRERAWSVWGFGVVRKRLGSKTNETLRGKGPVASDLQSVCVGVRHGWNVSEKLEK